MPKIESLPRLASHTERAIAGARVVLAAASLFAIWLDATEPARYVELTYTLQTIYVAYAVILAGLMWNHSGAGRLPGATHAADIVLCSIFQYLTLGPSSPFFVYFVFSVFCGALRWGWQGTLGTSIVVMLSYVVMGAWMSRTLGPTEFELNRFIIRTVYLGVVAALLVYLGQHEIRLRSKIERLARWPMPGNAGETLARVLEYAAGTVGAGRALVAWDSGDEPWVYLASWPASPLVVTKHAPADLEPLVPIELDESVLFSVAPVTESSNVLVKKAATFTHWRGMPVHRRVLDRLGGVGLASAPFRTERVSGRAFFSDLGSPTAESPVLTEVVARALGESIDQLQAGHQLLEIGAREQRILLARDLHDGVLQSLTGIRFELQKVADTLSTESAEISSARLRATERALAIEQRELRQFIDGLKPTTTSVSATGLTTRLQALRERVSLEWKIPITIRVGAQTAPLPAQLDDALPFMAHEAVVNALKHARPSRVSVEVDHLDGLLRLVVIDDGCGFPFRGTYAHARLREAKYCPVSLFERTNALGGRMKIESTDKGSRVEISLPLPVAIV